MSSVRQVDPTAAKRVAEQCRRSHITDVQAKTKGVKGV
jgi:hypothetical protein